MEKTNLNFSTVITNVDDDSKKIQTNNFIDTNNYVRQNLYNKQDKTSNFNNTENEESVEFLTNQRSRSIVKDNFNLDEYTRRKVIPISNTKGNSKVTRINIDSRYRDKTPKNVLDSVQHFLGTNRF